MVDEPVAPPTYYNPDNDPVAGGSHFDHSAQPGARVYDPSKDPITGVTPGDDAPSLGARILNTSWRKISDGATALWDLDKGGTTLFQTPENRTAGWEGLKRGVGDVSDFFINETTKAQQQAALERQANEQQYGDNSSYRFGRFVGQTGATLPVTIPLGGATTALTRAALSPVVDTAVARGLPGILGRATERAVPGAVLGGTQAGLTADPTRPFWPQVAEGTAAGAFLPVAAGLVTDPLTAAIRRLTGATVPLDYNKAPFGVDQERAKNAQILLDHGVPVKASQVSNDKALQAVDKYGSEIPGSGSASYATNQQQAFRAAALRKADPMGTGSVVDKAFNDRMDAATTSGYDNTVRAVPSVSDVRPGFVPGGAGISIADDFNAIRSRMSNSLNPDQRIAVNGAMKDIEDAFARGNGQLTGAEAHELIQRSGPTLDSLLSDPKLRPYGQDIHGVVNDRLQAQMTPAQQALYEQTNQQYRAWKTLKGVADANGNFEAGPLNKAAGDVADRYGGEGVLDKLARAGDGVLAPSNATGPVMTGVMKATPALGAVATGAAIHPLVDAVTTGQLGAGSASVAASIALLNKLAQAGNRAGGPRAINATLSGGGAPVSDIQRALMALGVGQPSLPYDPSRLQPQPTSQ